MKFRIDVVNFFKALIPGLPNSLVVGALRFFSIFSYIPRKKRILHLEDNKDKDKGEYIEDQNLLKSLPFGSTDMAYAGCEVIAVYNLLKNLGEYTCLNDLIETFEKKGTVFNGYFGTSPYALYKFLKNRGFDVEFSARKRDFDKIAKDSRVFIITFYNDFKNIMNMIHTVCVTKNEEGLFFPHNCFCKRYIPGDISKIEKNVGIEGRGRIIFMIGVK